MPCYQSTNLPPGFPTTGRTSYATEAECNQACKEGACCQGTSCTVKPQCQCQCTSGSCCGPDTITVDGTTGPQCRGGTKAECDQRGGLWVCGFACSVDEKTGLGTCSSVMMSNPNAPVFKGVGTVCTPNPCDTICKPCNGGTQPSKATVTAVVDNIVLNPNPSNPFTIDQLNGWLAGTYVLNKTDIGNADLVAYTFGGFPVPIGSRSVDIIYDCRVSGSSYIDTQGGPVCTVTYRQPGFEIKLFCFPTQSTQRGNVCDGTEERASGNIFSTGNILAGTGRMTVS